MGIQDVIALLVVATACAYVGRTFWRHINKDECGCGTATCKRRGSKSPPGSAGLKRTPLVPLDQLTNADADGEPPADGSL